jgi:predicted PurR-regulated permease PerM
MVRRRLPSPQPEPDHHASLQARVGWTLAFVCILSGLVWVMWSIVSIVLAAAALAYLLDPIADRLEARGRSRTVAIGIIFATTGLVFTIAGLVLVPLMAAQFIELSGNVRGYIDNIAGLIQPAAVFIEGHTGQAIPVDLEGLKAQLPDWISQLSPDTRKGIQGFLGRFFASSLGLFTAIMNLALLPIFTFYLLSEWDRMVSFVADIIPLRHRPRMNRLARDVDERLAAFVRGQLTVCVVLAVLYSLGLLLADVDMALSVGLLSGALFVVPYLGTIVGIALASVLCLMKFGIDIHLLYVALAFGIPQFIESWYLTPKVVGDKVGLHPLIVMIALLAGGGLAGIWGMLLAIPLTAVLDVLAREALSMYRDSSVFHGGRP